MGSLAQNSSGATGAAATPGSGEGSGGFRSLPAQIADEVPEGFGAGSGGFRAESSCRQGFGGFWCRWLMRFWRVLQTRFRRVPAQMADEVPEGSERFWCRLQTRFRRVPVQMADEVPEGSGADG